VVPTPPRVLRRKLVIYAVVLAYVVTVALGVFLVDQDKSLSRSQVLSSIGLNLLSSAVFGLIFAVAVTRIQGSALADDLEEHFAVLAKQLVDGLDSSSKSYLPDAVYSPSDGFDPQFNRDLTQALDDSMLYAFNGPNPRFVATRLSHARHPPDRVLVRTLNPTFAKALVRRASDARATATKRDRSVAELADALRLDIAASIVALFDRRHICPIDVILTEDPSVTRWELFDSGVFISWYHGPQSAGLEFPESLRFGTSSTIYKTWRLEAARWADVAQTCFRLNSATTEPQLEAILRDVLSISGEGGVDFANLRQHHLVSTSDLARLLSAETRMT